MAWQQARRGDATDELPEYTTTEELIEQLGWLISELRAEWRAEIACMKQDILDEVERRSKVVDLPRFLGKRDAA
jgi:hypothetical protein